MLATTPSSPVPSALYTPLLHHSVYKPLTPTPLLLLLRRNIHRQRPPKSAPCPSSNCTPLSTPHQACMPSRTSLVIPRITGAPKTTATRKIESERLATLLPNQGGQAKRPGASNTHHNHDACICRPTQSVIDVDQGQASIAECLEDLARATFRTIDRACHALAVACEAVFTACELFVGTCTLVLAVGRLAFIVGRQVWKLGKRW